MENAVFNKDLYRIEGDDIELRLINTYEGEDGALPFYWWDIVLKSNNTPVGKISFRIGHNYHSYYNGNIGYEIDENMLQVIQSNINFSTLLVTHISVIPSITYR